MLSGQFIVSVLFLLQFARRQVFQLTHTHTHRSSQFRISMNMNQNKMSTIDFSAMFLFVCAPLPIAIIIITTTGSCSHNRPDGLFGSIVVSVGAVGCHSRPLVTCLWYVINTNKHTHTQEFAIALRTAHKHIHTNTHATIIVYAFTMEIQFDTLFVFLFCFQLERERVSLYALFWRCWFTFVFAPSRRLHANRIASRIKYTAPMPMPLFPVVVGCFTCICGE